MAVRREGFLDVWEAARARLACEPLPRLLVIAGEDGFLKERLLEALPDADHETFARRPDEPEGAAFLRLLDDWTTASLFVRDRVLLAREADALLGSQAAIRTARLAALADVLDAGTPPHRLVLTLASLDGRSRLARRLKSAGGLISLPPLRDAPPPWQADADTAETELNRWLMGEAAALGWRLDLPDADALTQRVGNEPATLLRKIDQIGALIAGRTSIGVADVAAHVQHTSARLLGLYEDALRRRELATALGLLDQMGVRGVLDHTGRVVSGAEAADAVLRGVTSNLARLVDAHEGLDDDLRAALSRPPWKRSAPETAGLDAALGAGGRRVFLERDVRAVGAAGARAAFDVALAALRALRDGAGGSLHATTARLVAALGSAA